MNIYLCAYSVGIHLAVEVLSHALCKVSFFFKCAGKIHHFTAFSTFTMLCDHLCLVAEHSHSPSETLSPWAVTPHLSAPAPGTMNPLSVCGLACSGRFLQVESHTVCPSVSASLTEHPVFKVYPRCSPCQSFTPFHGCIIFHSAVYIMISDARQVCKVVVPVDTPAAL